MIDQLVFAAATLDVLDPLILPEVMVPAIDEATPKVLVTFLHS